MKYKPFKIKQNSKIWKSLFLILLAFNLALGIFVTSRIYNSREPDLKSLTNQPKTGTALGKVSTNKEQLNRLINTYLSNRSDQKLAYTFYLTDSHAVMEMDYHLFGSSVPLYLYFQPSMSTDGSIVLAIQSISAGSLSLPTSAVLGFVKSVKLPNFVTINSSDSTVKIDLSQLLIAQKYFLKADTIDMSSGRYVFEIMQK